MKSTEMKTNAIPKIWFNCFTWKMPLWQRTMGSRVTAAIDRVHERKKRKNNRVFVDTCTYYASDCVRCERTSIEKSFMRLNICAHFCSYFMRYVRSAHQSLPVTVQLLCAWHSYTIFAQFNWKIFNKFPALSQFTFFSRSRASSSLSCVEQNRRDVLHDIRDD